MRRKWTAPVIALVVAILAIGTTLCIKFDVFRDINIDWPWHTEEKWTQWTSYHYFNDDMKGTAHPHHFGPDRYALFQTSKTEDEGKKYASEYEYLVRWTRMNFYSSIETDPCLAAGCIYYAQKVTREDFLGTLQGNTDETRVNYAHYLMRSSPEYWKTVVTKFEKYLDKNYSFGVVDIGGEYTSSSYQKPGAASFDSSAPRMIWESSRNRDGHWFELTRLEGKDGGTLKLRYRMECGYQFPTEHFTSGGDDPVTPPVTPTNPPVNPTPTPTPGGEDEPKKNPELDPVNQGNADRGGGENLPTDDTGKYQPDEPVVAQDTVISGSPESGSRGGGNTGHQSEEYPDTTPGTKTKTETTTSGGTTTTKKETTTTSIDGNGTVVRDITTEVTVADNAGHSTTVKETEKKFDSGIVDNVEGHSSITTDSTGQTVVVEDNSASDGVVSIP